MSTAAVSVDDGRMPLMEHLRELRSRIVKVAIALAIGMLLGFLLYNRIFDILIEPYKHVAETTGGSLTGGDLIATDPLEGFAVRLKISLYAGIFFAMPVILWQLWRFITPGLYAHEKKYAIPFVVSALFLFALGAGLAFWTLPQALNWLQSIAGDNIVSAYAPGKYFTLITYMMLAFGVGFEFPIVLVFLQMVGVLNPRMLARVRRYAWVGITVLVAIITPSGDPISMLALSLPMILFYEIAIVVGRLIERRKTRPDPV
jgi:sec-independent protein translocase protein TatC